MTINTERKSVRLFMGGVTGSNNVSEERYIRDYEGPAITTRPFSRGHFGQHTTSIGIIIGQTGIFIDNGTGVGQTSEWLRAHGVTQVFGLQTHYHLDHMAGVVSNSFLMARDGIVHGLYGPKLGEFEFAGAMEKLFNEPYWPVSPEKMGIKLPFHSFNPGDILPIMGGIRTLALNHAGGSVGYRIPTPAGDIVIATDNELSTPEMRQTAADFFAGAQVVYVDVQYRDDEYTGKRTIGHGHTTMSRKGWGHSTPAMLMQTYQLINQAPAMTLIGHHDPKRPDEDVFQFEKETRQTFEGLGTHIEFAAEHRTYPFYIDDGAGFEKPAKELQPALI